MQHFNEELSNYEMLVEDKEKGVQRLETEIQKKAKGQES